MLRWQAQGRDLDCRARWAARLPPQPGKLLLKEVQSQARQCRIKAWHCRLVAFRSTEEMCPHCVTNLPGCVSLRHGQNATDDGLCVEIAQRLAQDIRHFAIGGIIAACEVP